MLQSAKSELADLQVEQQREMEGLLEVCNLQPGLPDGFFPNQKF
jgi:hypothetical protein